MIKKVTIFQGNFSYGGAEVVGLNLANSFADMGIEVTMLCLKDKGDLRQRLSQKVKVVSLNTRLLFCLPALEVLFYHLMTNQSLYQQFVT